VGRPEAGAEEAREAEVDAKNAGEVESGGPAGRGEEQQVPKGPVPPRGQEERGGRGGVSQHRVAGGEGLGRAGPEPEPRGGGEKEGALAPEGAEHGVGRVEEHHLENQPRRGPPRGERGVHTVGREEAARIIKENSVRAVPGDSRQQAIPERRDLLREVEPPLAAASLEARDLRRVRRSASPEEVKLGAQESKIALRESAGGKGPGAPTIQI